ncbi:MAG: pyruvate, phosphate dikinase [Candidatus Omnitrophica bacterium CG1_02_44_16]|nr:MAG: pyruvate, phosphate dikinase [Candidatus Omnitrophica bacterium CG1_02_44_16]PIY82138.1 MAG: pyruvate, phosphate dikinase [Candidatus Omnitrophica bacterium CG_4_10_14_0_8_um_filter_44_12]
MSKKNVYSFGGGKADGNESMKNLLGGKGANLAEMAGHPKLRLPVPPGFTITTEVCAYYYKNNKKYPKELKLELEKALKKVEALMGRKFGDPNNPLLVSVRSGARKSMPGMMETVLNVGLTEKTIPGMIKQAGGNSRFVYDAYRRLIMMYSDVVMEKASGVEPKEDMGIRKQLERVMGDVKQKKGYKSDTDLKTEDLKYLCSEFKKKIADVLGKEFPDEPMAQLWGGIGAVFASWNGKRAIAYRNIEKIPHEWGTAVTVQTMVFGNMGDDSATGVAFTRNPGNGDAAFYGEYLINAQGEDVVAGIRTPAPINKYSQSEHNKDLKTLEQIMPKVYKELFDIQERLEQHYRDMQDIEFTIEKGRLFMLQCRIGKRNGPASVKIALDMVKEKFIKTEEAVARVTPEQLDELLHPIIDPIAERGHKALAKGLPAGPGAASGTVVFTSADAVRSKNEGKKVILVREETNPEDIDGMRAAEAILTARGGMTSHAALVARGWGKCCVVGCSALEIDVDKKEIQVDGKTIKEGEWITLNGTKGLFYLGQLKMMDASSENEVLNAFLKLCDSIRTINIRTNADTPEDARKARQFGAEGIGLFRTEHMFYGKGSEEPLFKLRKMIMSNSTEERRKALEELFPYMKSDIKNTLEAMDGLPVTIRLLDPPLHEFVPHQENARASLAQSLNISAEELEKRANSLAENNPMMGHRGVRLGVTYPEVSETQFRAIFESGAELIKAGKKVLPEIMIPVVCDVNELTDQLEIAKKVYQEVLSKFGLKKIDHMFGTMIEIPRAALVADKIAEVASFFSFGTNDLTQMAFGFSRDDIGAFVPEYIKKGILSDDPFQTIDQIGVGELIKIGIDRGRKTNKKLKVGICGEHGGEPKSIDFCYRVGMNYVSCSPFRVPIARLAAARAVLANSPVKRGKKK